MTTFSEFGKKVDQLFNKNEAAIAAREELQQLKDEIKAAKKELENLQSEIEITTAELTIMKGQKTSLQTKIQQALALLS